MTESVSFSSASGVNPPASAAESISVNSHNELSTGAKAVVNPEATNRGVDNRVVPDRDTVVRFLKALYPHVPQDRDDTGLIGLTAFTVTGRSDNRIAGRLGTWPEKNITHDHEWLADKVMGLATGVRPTGEESPDHYPLVPVTGVFIRLPTLMGEWPTGNQRGGQANVRALVGFVLDGDYQVAGHHERSKSEGKYPHPESEEEVRGIWSRAIAGGPTLVWNSGGGVNGAWLLEEPVLLGDDEDGAALLKEWRETSGRFHDRVIRAANELERHHDSVPNNDRLMRIAGTVNAKAGVERKLSTVVQDDGPRYTLEQLFDLAPAPEELADGSLVDTISGDVIREARPEPRVRQAGGARAGSFGAAEKPGEHFDRETGERGGFRDLLRADGWEENGFSGGTLHLTRPGKQGSRQTSATLGANDGTGGLSADAKFFNFSDNAPAGLDRGRGFRTFLSPYWYLVHTRYQGDASACAKDLYAKGYGSRWVPDEVVDTKSQTYEVWATEEFDDQEQVVSEPPTADGSDAPADADEWPADRLPETFWKSTWQLQKIRQMARARRASPDAVLHAVLARTAAMADPTVRADSGIQKPATLCWYSGLFGPSGSGKGNAENTAEELTPFPTVDFAHIDISTGQGIIAAYLDQESDPEDDSGKKKILIQRRTRGYALATEGSVLDAMSKMNAGGTLNGVLCAGWMSERQGTSNATVELRRALPKGAYTLSMSLGVQEEPAAKLLEMGNIGLPQRLAWAHAALGSDTPEKRPETTGPVTVTLRTGEDVPVTTWVSTLKDLDIQIPGHASKEIDDLILANSFGRGAEFPLDTHEPLWRLKCAALMALLHGRTDVRAEEWDLATVLWETSRKVRDRVQDAAERRLASAAAAKRAETVQTAAESQAAVYEVIHGVHPTVVNVAKRAHRYLVKHKDEVTARDMNRACVAKKDRDKYKASGATEPLWAEALRYGCEQGWLVVLEGDVLAVGAVSPG